MSIAGGYYRAADEAARLGMDTVQIFTKSNAQWVAKPLSDDDVRLFREAVERHNLRRNCSHASYLINPATEEPEKRERAIAALVVELERAEAFGLDGVVLHPGAHKDAPREVGLDRVVAAIDETHRRTPGLRVQIYLEAMAGQGTCLGHRFEELAAMIDRAGDPDRLGVCLDTCHIFAAGYELTTQSGYDETMRQLDETIGIGRVRVFHLNDSKHPIGSRRDRHEHIGEGHLGDEPFRRLLNDPRFATVPMVFETKKEIRDGEEMDAVNLARLRSLKTLS